MGISATRPRRRIGATRALGEIVFVAITTGATAYALLMVAMVGGLGQEPPEPLAFVAIAGLILGTVGLLVGVFAAGLGVSALARWFSAGAYVAFFLVPTIAYDPTDIERWLSPGSVLVPLVGANVAGAALVRWLGPYLSGPRPPR